MWEGGENPAKVRGPHAPVDSTWAEDVDHGSDSLGSLFCQAFTMDYPPLSEAHTCTYTKGSANKSRYCPHLKQDTKLVIFVDKSDRDLVVSLSVGNYSHQQNGLGIYYKDQII